MNVVLSRWLIRDGGVRALLGPGEGLPGAWTDRFARETLRAALLPPLSKLDGMPLFQRLMALGVPCAPVPMVTARTL